MNPLHLLYIVAGALLFVELIKVSLFKKNNKHEAELLFESVGKYTESEYDKKVEYFKWLEKNMINKIKGLENRYYISPEYMQGVTGSYGVGYGATGPGRSPIRLAGERGV